MKYPLFSSLTILSALCALSPSTSYAHAQQGPLEETFVAEDFLLKEQDNDLLSSFDFDEEIESSVFTKVDSVIEQNKEITSSAFPLASIAISQNKIARAPTPSAPILEKNSYFLSVGGDYTYVHLSPGDSPSFYGSLGGMQALFEFRPLSGFYGAVKANWRQGETKSDDATRFLVDVTAEERFGFSASADNQRWTWTLFSGLGYRYLGHHLKQSGEGSLRFNYNEFYCPVGVFSDYAFTSFFSFGIHATWMPQIFPTVTIIPLKGARWATKCELSNVLIEAPFTFFAGEKKNFFITINPAFQFWQDGKSSAATSTGKKLNLAHNSYYFWGADLNVGYAF